MAVNLRVRFEVIQPFGAGRLETVAVVNTGYRPGLPECALPAFPAQRLGFWPKLPPSARRITVATFGGPSSVWELPWAVRMRVVAPDRKGAVVEAGLLINEKSDEILLSDALTGALGIAIVDSGRGLWCFRDELGRRERPSEPPLLWPPPAPRPRARRRARPRRR